MCWLAESDCAKITGRERVNARIPKQQQPVEGQPMSKSDSSRIIRTYKFRLWTNANQERELAIMLETHRRLYNATLDGKKLCWETAKADWSFYEQSKWFTVHRRTNPYFARLNFSSAEQTLRRLDKAYRALFVGRSRHPRFKSTDRFNSFGYNLSGKGGGCKVVEGKLRLQHVGSIRVKWHRQLPSGGRVVEVRVVRQGKKWYAAFVVESPANDKSQRPGAIGIDVGLSSFVTTSQGDVLGDSRLLERARPELRLAQRALGRCIRGSNRRQKAKQRVIKCHAKVRESRRDMHHKVSRSLVDRYGTIVAERLNIQGMLKNRRLARRISDAGWSGFLSILASKAESAGGQVSLVDPKNTSQACSACGSIVEKSLSVRVHSCDCGCVLDRDVNAARNILARGLGRTVPGGVNAAVALRSPGSPASGSSHTRAAPAAREV